MYKELDQIIDEYVGVEPVEQMVFNDKGETDYEIQDYVSNDPDLRDRIGVECTKHLNNAGLFPLSKMCPEARKCFEEWEILMKSATEQPRGDM